MKIKNIEISGIRGIQEPLSIIMDSKSLLLFGENGSGKTSITDSIEWFYYNKVAHLASKEIGGGATGKEAMRNILIDNATESKIRIELNEKKINKFKFKIR